MIFGTPISWLAVEFTSLVLFCAVIAHALRQEQPRSRVLEVFAFVALAAVFENLGVYVARAYYYDVRRVMMIGGVPLQILLLEAVIWYAAFNLARCLKLPGWCQPIAAGFFCMLQDLTIDPAAVFDRHALGNPLLAQQLQSVYPGAFGPHMASGQWNWTNPGYAGLFFGIPFYNYTGWLTMMAYYSAFIVLFRWIGARRERRWLAASYPFVAALLALACIASPVNAFIVQGAPFLAGASRRIFEIIVLCFFSALAIGLLAGYRHRIGPIDWRRNGPVVFGIPVFLHGFDCVYVAACATRVAYLPVALFSALHLAYLFWVWRRSRPAGPVSMTRPARG